jgi:enolase
MKIINIIAKEILDSKALPTIECEVHLESGEIVSACVPSDYTQYNAKEIRDNKERFFGQGVLNSVEIINNVIAPQFIGKEPNAIEMDVQMLQMDETEDKNKIGANTVLAVSMAMYRAHALASNLQLFDFIAVASGSDTVSLPIPMINILESNKNLIINEFFIIPFGGHNISDVIEKSINFFHTLNRVLANNQVSFANYNEPLQLIKSVFEKLKLSSDSFAIGLGFNTNQFYNSKNGTYLIDNKEVTSENLINLFLDLYEKFDIYSIQDGLAIDDTQGWIKLMDKFNNKIHIIGGNLFATNIEKIAKGIELGLCNTVVINPVQIGTITETLQAIKLCQENGFSVVVSNSQRETNDNFIVDLAIGSNANYLKCGQLVHGENISKYNRLIEIENLLTGLDNN